MLKLYLCVAAFFSLAADPVQRRELRRECNFARAKEGAAGPSAAGGKGEGGWIAYARRRP
jgi:hypothetical protein